MLLLLDPMPAFNLELAPQDVQPVRSGACPVQANLSGAARTCSACPGRPTGSPGTITIRIRNSRACRRKSFSSAKASTRKIRSRAGLQEVVLLYPGVLKSQGGAPFVPLLDD